jgi:hypothetical protein
VTAEQGDGQDRGADSRASAEHAAEPRDRETYASDIRSTTSQETDSTAANEDRPGAVPDAQTQPGPAETGQLAEPRPRDEYAADLRAARPGDSQEAGTAASAEARQPQATPHETSETGATSQPDAPGDGLPADSASPAAAEQNLSETATAGAPAREQQPPSDPDRAAGQPASEYTTSAATTPAATDQPAQPDPGTVQAESQATDAMHHDQPQETLTATPDNSEQRLPGTGSKASAGTEEAERASADDRSDQGEPDSTSGGRPPAENTAGADAAYRPPAEENQTHRGRPDSPAGQADQPDQPASHGPITHYHGEFKGQQIGLYTDGTRWAPGDRQQGENVVGEKPEKSPGDISDLPPTGDQLIDSAGEDSSRAERLRHQLYEASGDILDTLDKTADTAHDMLARPQLRGHDVSPAGGPYVSPAPHDGIEADSVLTAAFVAGLLADRCVRWIRQHWKRP